MALEPAIPFKGMFTLQTELLILETSKTIHLTLPGQRHRITYKASFYFMALKDVFGSELGTFLNLLCTDQG